MSGVFVCCLVRPLPSLDHLNIWANPQTTSRPLRQAWRARDVAKSRPHAIFGVGKHAREPLNNGLTHHLDRAASAVPPRQISWHLGIYSDFWLIAEHTSSISHATSGNMADSENEYSDDEIVTGKGKGRAGASNPKRAHARWENLATNTHGLVDGVGGMEGVLGGVEEADKRRR